jgi:hypothetical protein
MDSKGSKVSMDKAIKDIMENVEAIKNSKGGFDLERVGVIINELDKLIEMKPGTDMDNNKGILDKIRGNFSYEPGQKVLVKTKNGWIPGQVQSLQNYTVRDMHSRYTFNKLNPAQVESISPYYENWLVVFKKSKGGLFEGILKSANYIVDIDSFEKTVPHTDLKPATAHSTSTVHLGPIESELEVHTKNIMDDSKDILDKIRGTFRYEPGQKVLVKTDDGLIPGQVKSLQSYTVSNIRGKPLRDRSGNIIRDKHGIVIDELNPYEVIHPSKINKNKDNKDGIKTYYENWLVAFKDVDGNPQDGILKSANYIVDIGDIEKYVPHTDLKPVDGHSSPKHSSPKHNSRKLGGRKLGHKLGGRKLGKTIKNRKL